MISKECETYWDEHSSIHIKENGQLSLIDNYWKRQVIVKRLLDLDLVGKDILEIGVGSGTAFAAIRLIMTYLRLGSNMDVTCCHVSE